MRDVYDRTVSALLYHHPDNAKYYNLRQTGRQKHFGPLAYQCFPTLESFAALMIRGNQTDCNYPYRQNIIDPSDCVELACATIHGRIRFFAHLFFNFRNIIDTKLPQEPPRQIYTIRQEFLWDDWKRLNQLLGQQDPVVIPSEESNQRNVSHLALPVNRQISDEGRLKLCKALESEYFAYFRLLHKAINLNKDDWDACITIASKNCPNLDFVAMLRTIKRGIK